MWNERSPLTTRWTPAERKRINRSLARAAYRFLEDLPYVTHDGRRYVDLRGFPFESHFLTDLKRVDFSDSNMQQGGVGREIHVSDCIFRGARLWTTIGYVVRRCDFTGAHMKGVDLRGTFRQCNFAGANLVGARCVPETRFLRCDFRSAKLRNWDFTDAVFNRCQWEGAKIDTGSVAGSRFIGTRPTKKQLGDTIMESDVDEAMEAEILAEVAAEIRRQRAAQRARKRAKRSRD